MTVPAGEPFETGVTSIVGTWPATPTRWSFSSLMQAEACPRQWMLSRASYPTVWTRPGYPERPNIASIAGDVIHGALEEIVRGFVGSGCVDPGSAEAVHVLRELGGYSKIIDRAITNRLVDLGENPRAVQQLHLISDALRKRAPEFRTKVQSIISRLPPSAASSGHDKSAATDEPGRLAPGVYAEVGLSATTLAIGGRIDLLRVFPDGSEIIDYKTGAPNDHHAEQLRFYALLWSRDALRNPDNTPPRRLLIAYPTHDDELPVPDDGDLTQLEHEVVDRLASAEECLAERPPPARPSPDVCKFCSVRHLCDEYWDASSNAHTDTYHVPEIGTSDTRFRDAQITIGGRNGPTSWDVTLHGPEMADGDGVRALLRTPDDTAAFEHGREIRLLGVMETHDTDFPNRPLLTLTSASEVYECA